jgi:hypothetical protein
MYRIRYTFAGYHYKIDRKNPKKLNFYIYYGISVKNSPIRTVTRFVNIIIKIIKGSLQVCYVFLSYIYATLKFVYSTENSFIWTLGRLGKLDLDTHKKR